MTFGNKEIRAKVVRKKGVLPGFRGEELEYIVHANKYFSNNSQEEADSLALNDVSVNGQAFADKHGRIGAAIFYNSKISKIFKKSGCVLDKGSMEEYIVPEGKYISNISQDDADNKAKSDIDSNGQRFADLNGVCCPAFESRKFVDIFYKQGCEEGYRDRDGVEFILPKGAVVSEFSQTDADEDAYKIFLAKGQEYANANGVCNKIYYNDKQHAFFTRECKDGYQAEFLSYTVKAGTVESFVSVEDANRMAKELLNREGQRRADRELVCEPKK